MSRKNSESPERVVILRMGFGRRLADVIEKRRIEHGLSKGANYEWFAEQIGCSASAIRDQWEKGGSPPSLDKVFSICEVLGVSADWLLFGVEAESQTKSEAADCQKCQKVKWLNELLDAKKAEIESAYSHIETLKEANNLLRDQLGLKRQARGRMGGNVRGAPR